MPSPKTAKEITVSKSVAEVFGIQDDQSNLFTKAVSIGLLAGSAMSVAQRRCMNRGLNAVISGRADIGEEVKRILIENRNKQYPGLSRPVTDEEIEAILEVLTAENGRMFFNNVIMAE
jgi:hypothetical protein